MLFRIISKIVLSLFSFRDKMFLLFGGRVVSDRSRLLFFVLGCVNLFLLC